MSAGARTINGLVGIFCMIVGAYFYGGWSLALFAFGLGWLMAIMTEYMSIAQVVHR
jgi:hypothetical protein